MKDEMPDRQAAAPGVFDHLSAVQKEKVLAFFAAQSAFFVAKHRHLLAVKEREAAQVNFENAKAAFKRASDELDSE